MRICQYLLRPLSSFFCKPVAQSGPCLTAPVFCSLGSHHLRKSFVCRGSSYRWWLGIVYIFFNVCEPLSFKRSRWLQVIGGRTVPRTLEHLVWTTLDSIEANSHTTYSQLSPNLLECWNMNYKRINTKSNLITELNKSNERCFDGVTMGGDR